MDPHNRSNGHHILEESASQTPSARMTMPTPLFERLVTEEVQEVRAYARIVESQNKRVNELERVHGDLETRLEHETRERAQLETTLERREQEWAARFKQLEASRDDWRKQVDVEKGKIVDLKKTISKLEQHIQKMLQRKYDKKGDSPSTAHPIRNSRPPMNDRSTAPQGQAPNSQDWYAQRDGGNEQRYRSPRDIMVERGSIEAIRTRDVQNLLSEFFSL